VEVSHSLTLSLFLYSLFLYSLSLYSLSFYSLSLYCGGLSLSRAEESIEREGMEGE